MFPVRSWYELYGNLNETALGCLEWLSSHISQTSNTVWDLKGADVVIFISVICFIMELQQMCVLSITTFLLTESQEKQKQTLQLVVHKTLVFVE